MVTLSEIRAHNKRVGGHFFDRGNAPVVNKVFKDKYLLTQNGDRDGWLVYRYDVSGNIIHVGNPALEYDWKPMSKDEALNFIKTL